MVRREESFVKSLRRLAAAVPVIAALLAGAAPAMADTASIAFLDAAGRDDPVAGIGRALTLSGNTSAPKRVYIRYRPTGGAPCAPSASSDSGSDYGQFSYFSGDQFNGSSVNGNFTFRKTGTWNESGTVTFCIWLADSESAVATPIRQDVTFRVPTGTVSGSISPASPQVSEAATVTITGSSEAPKRVYATYRLTGGAPCAISYDADSGRGVVNGTNVNGAFSFTQSLTISTPGTYMLCMWLADASNDSAPVAGPQSATFVVPTPCIVPELSPGATLTTVRSQLAAANCAVGTTTREASATIKNGRLIRLGSTPHASLAPGAPISVVLSSGRPCVVPSSPAGLTLRRAKSRLKAAGCTAGSVSRVRSARRKGTVVSFSPRAGKTLASRAVVKIRVSRGRH
jgi:hypothetical protein